MTKQEIYEHLANVYLGKTVFSEKRSKRQLKRRLIWKITLGVTVSVTAFYGLTAFLNKREHLKSQVLFGLNHSPIRVKYDLTDPFPKIEQFTIQVPPMDGSRYSELQFAIRGTEEGHPGIVKIVVRNRKNEVSSYYAQGIRVQWQDFRIPLEEFKEISDWSNIKNVSFVLEEWNVEKKRGIMLVDDVCFSS